MKPEEVERSFARGQQILERGATTRVLFIVRSGGVELDPGYGRPLRRLAGGELFGEISGILGRPSPYSAMADEDTVVLALEIPLINRMCRESPEFSMRLIRHLASEWLRALDDPPVVDLPDGLDRLAGALLARKEGGAAPLVPGRLCDLARDAGLSMLEAYHSLHELLDRGWVQLSEDQLSIVALDALQSLVPER